jgi:hypothetical protein
MTLDEQINTLIREAPAGDAMPALVSAIAPVLKRFAEQLRYTEYYVLQNLNEQWLSTTLQQQGDTEPILKTVIYGYGSLKDASGGWAIRDPELMALPVPVIDILFRLYGMDGVDSVLFFDVPGKGTEVFRLDLHAAIEQHLANLMQPNPILPSDIA